MPSVVASWGGRCRDRVLQEALVAHLHEIAAFTQALVAPEAPVDIVDATICGTILVDPGLLPNDHPRDANSGFGQAAQIRLYGLSFRPLLEYDLYRWENKFSFLFVRAPDQPELDGMLAQLVRRRGFDPLRS